MNETINGRLVGVIHRVHPDNEESTLLFFSNQAVHQANGFHLQDQDGKAALQIIVATIYGAWSYVDCVETLASKPKELSKTIHYCFGPDSFFEKKLKNTNLGYNCYLDYIQRIYLEELGESIIMKEAFDL